MNISLQTEPNELSRQLAALGHPARIDILRHLACEDGRCCKEVVGVLDLAQSTVSQHLKVLVDAGLVGTDATADGECLGIHPDTIAAFDGASSSATESSST